MNGVMADSVSAGSSQRGASVTCTPKLIWPSGAAPTAAGRAAARQRIRAIATRQGRAVWVIQELRVNAAVNSAAGVGRGISGTQPLSARGRKAAIERRLAGLRADSYTPRPVSQTSRRSEPDTTPLPIAPLTESFVPFGPPAAERSLVRRFARQVAEHGGRLAAQIGGESITYGELDEAATRVSNALLHALGGDAEPVAMLLGPGTAQVAAHLGVLKSGKVCVPLDPAQPQPRLARIVADTGARMLLTDRARRHRAADLADGSIAVGADRSASRPAVLDVGALPPGARGTSVQTAIAPEALAYVFYTAGSTGEPKGVMQSHGNLLQVARLYHDETRLRPSDRILCPMPLTYAGGVWGMLGALASGASLHRACRSSCTRR